MRYDLQFFLCCCRSFLGSSTQSSTDYYELLGVDRDAAQDEIKRAYKRQSLQMHPDKLAQRGKQVTDEDQAKFQKMKEAYEVLSDPHKRETYDAIGERGLKWIEEPFSLDPQEMANNFARSSALDRSKIFAIFVTIAVIIFLLPILICLKVDGTLGEAKWVAVLSPLWITNALVMLYHIRIINMGPIAKPEGVPDSEWVDPLPMSKRYFSLLRFLLLCAFEIMLSLRLDQTINWNWSIIFIPVYLHEFTTLFKKFPLARMKIVTVEDLETALGKPFSEFTASEKQHISRKYSVVPSIESTEFETAHRLKSRARQDVIKVIFRAVFIAFIVTQLEAGIDWNWWLVFLPVWLMSFCICCGSLQRFNEAQTAVMEKDPQMFAAMTGQKTEDEENGGNGSGGYGALEDKEGNDKKPEKELSEQEREELKTQFVHAGYKMIGSCFSQGFLLLVVGLFVGKLQGAGYSSIWILSPLLIVAAIILCCLGCTIFCITDGVEGVDAAGPSNGYSSTTGSAPATQDYVPPSVPQPVSSSAAVAPGGGSEGVSSYAAPKATWDPEKGQIWEGGNTSMPETSPDVTILAPPPTAAAVSVSPLVASIKDEPATNVAASGTAGGLGTGGNTDLISEPLLPQQERPEEPNYADTAIDELD